LNVILKCHIVQHREEKIKYCSYIDGYIPILIDDHHENISEWRNAGGVGILFENAAQALKDLQINIVC
jgi:hypothetical protein